MSTSKNPRDRFPKNDNIPFLRIIDILFNNQTKDKCDLNNQTKDKCDLNNQTKDKCDQVYRIITFNRIVELLDKKKNILVEPCRWNDPLEGWLHQEILRLKSETIVGKFFGQCWTKDRASDLMWNMYSEGTNGFRIRSTVNKLKYSLERKENGVHWYISSINYKNFSKLESCNKDCLVEDMESNDKELGLRYNLARSYMIKREAYKGEHEVRLICNWSEAKKEDRFFKYEICPNCVVDQIMMHPGMSQNDFSHFERIFRFLGFKGDITRSKLYEIPESLSKFCLTD